MLSLQWLHYRPSDDNQLVYFVYVVYIIAMVSRARGDRFRWESTPLTESLSAMMARLSGWITGTLLVTALFLMYMTTNVKRRRNHHD